MLRNVIGPLLAAVVGFFCVIGADGNNGGVQLVSIIIMCAAGGLAISLVGLRHITIFTIYCITLSCGAILSIIAHRAWGV